MSYTPACRKCAPNDGAVDQTVNSRVGRLGFMPERTHFR